MAFTADAESAELLREVVGDSLKCVRALQYRGYTSYERAFLHFARTGWVAIDLSCASVAPKFDTFVIRARREVPRASEAGLDQLDLSSFRVARVYLLQRKEWLSGPYRDPGGVVGSRPIEQRFAAIDDPSVPADGITVDAGVGLESDNGFKLQMIADTFPLVLQMSFALKPSPLPRHTRSELMPTRS